MKKIVGVITARMTSTRLPGKVLKYLCGKSVFAHHVERMRQVPGLSDIFLATSQNDSNAALIEESRRLNVPYYAGAEEDVVERHIAIARQMNADAVIRVTCDMPLFDVDILGAYIHFFNGQYADYMYADNMTMVQGTVGELISLPALERIHACYKGPAVSLPIKENMSDYVTRGLSMAEEKCRPEYRLTLDYPEDLTVIRAIYDSLYKGQPLLLEDVYRFLDDNPQIARLNADMKVKGNVRYGAQLLDNPKFTITESGQQYVILNENKNIVLVEDFIAEFKKMFPSYFSDR